MIKKRNKKLSGNRYHEIVYQKVLHHVNITQILAFYKINELSKKWTDNSSVTDSIYGDNFLDFS